MQKLLTVTALASALLATTIHAQQIAAAKPPASPHHATTSDEAAAKNDPMLQAMQAELNREKDAIVLPGMQHPYFIEYRLEDIVSYDVQAGYGALTGEDETHQKVVRVNVRIGSFTSDNSGGRGDGSVQLGPEDTDPVDLQYALWTATDEAYKSALSAYTTKQAALKRFQNPPTADDFAPAKPVMRIEPTVALDLDKAEWKRRIVEASGLYATDPEVKSFTANVQSSNASLRALAVNRYLVNTEGTMLRQGYTAYEASISVGGQAPDGMQLARGNGTSAASAKDLESAALFRKRTIDNLKSLEALRNAPLADAEDYHGPVLFSGEAAADVMTRLFVPNVEANRPEMGTTARARGAYTSSLRSRVLPEFMDVVDDPGLKTFNGKSLVGAYDVDDEGVPEQKVSIVTHGNLESYDIGREPVKDFATSNGHGRAALAQAAHSRAAVLVFSAAKTETPAQMNERLLALAKEQGRDVYIAEAVAQDLSPRVLYRISPDGKKTLVRGAAFDELDNRSLRSEIIAAGSDNFVDNTLGQVPQTIIAPSLLFADITVKRATVEQQKLPYYAPPAEGKISQLQQANK